MFERLIEITENRAIEADKHFIASLNESVAYLQDLTTKLMLESNMPKLPEINKRIENLDVEVTSILSATSRTAASKEIHERIHSVVVEIHAIKNTLNKELSNMHKDAAFVSNELEIKTLNFGSELNPETKEQISGPISRAAKTLANASDSRYSVSVSAALQARKLFLEMQFAINEFLDPKNTNHNNLFEKTYEAKEKKFLIYLNNETKSHLIEGANKNNAMIIKKYIDTNFPAMEKLISQYVTAYLKQVKLKEHKESLDARLNSMLIKWQKLTVSREQYLTRDSLNRIIKSKNDPDYNGAIILKGLLKKQLQIPAYVEAEINELEKKLHLFEEEASKPNGRFKNFVSESQISLQLILHTIKNNLEKVKKLEINLLNTVMSKTYIHKLGHEATLTKSELNDLIVANEKNMNDTLKNATRWLGEIEKFIKLNYPELPPINAAPRQSQSSVAYLLGRIFNTPSATPTHARSPNPSPTSKAVPLDNKKTSFPSIFKPAPNNEVTKITGTVDELATAKMANKNVISPRRIKIEKEKERVKTLPNAVSRSKSPRR